MTKREQQIYDLITSNPFISQDEIASELHITRASVSVYITNMIKKGIIIGRGYFLEAQKTHENRQPVCIGTTAVDLFGEVSDEQTIEAPVILTMLLSASHTADVLKTLLKLFCTLAISQS